MLKIGVIGAGHLGKIHIKCINQIAEFQLVGFYDNNPTTTEIVTKEFDIRSFDSFEALLTEVDVVDIVTPTIAHFEHAATALRNNRHVFIEKPIVATPTEARQLVDIAHSSGVNVQVGHVERYNPAMTAALPFIENPMFIEVHRLSGFNPRGTDVPVVLDLMIHDIDIVLHTVKSEVKSIHASGVAVVTTTPDIVNARIEFKNGCVANLTSSRISLQNMRKARFFQRDAYIAVDFLNKKTEVAYLRNASDHLVHNSNQLIQPGNGLENKQIHFVNPTILPVNAIQTELTSFAHSILNNLVPEVTITDGYQALEIAYRILDQVALNQQHNNENAAQHATN